jgi:hypothetical protein
MTAQPLTFTAFADRYRLRTKQDACGDPIAPGKLGHLYQHGAGLAGLVLEDTRNGQSIARSLVARRRKALAAGFRLHLAGDVPGSTANALNACSPFVWYKSVDLNVDPRVSSKVLCQWATRPCK